ncbi:hypothetical protein CVT25_014831 [Psilocybe cyanescens]|uniref:Uncharacterized protein n=1 Tax=Psilocybe cyanescens TaxID=93625 RepID=A0A409WEU8_PSICY|nr:hypothetical protein CVT25_014831 [Psilocybe cyanescens]
MSSNFWRAAGEWRSGKEERCRPGPVSRMPYEGGWLDSVDRSSRSRRVASRLAERKTGPYIE